MSDTDDATADSTESTADGDVSRRDVLSKSGAGVGFAIWQSGWWGSGGSDSGGSGGWWGGGDDGGDDDGGWWGDDGDDGGTGGGGPDDNEKPLVFVHGGAGSATQFESQSMRFSSNGYPDDYLYAFEYDSLNYGGGGLGVLGDLLGGGVTQAEVHDALDQKVDDVLAETGEDEVYVMGHSLGTQVLNNYLSDANRAAKVAKYVHLDGFAQDSEPNGVPTLAVWSLGNTDTTYGGAENVHLDDQSHVELATSEETFAEVYEFLLEDEPETTQIEVEPADEVTIEGRTQVFPLNNAPDPMPTVDVFEVDPATGERLTDEPLRTLSMDAEGRWGPIDVDGSAYHEFRVTYPTGEVHSNYRQPEVRSNQFVRLLTSTPDSAFTELYATGPDHSMFITLRDKEWWGDQGANSDRLDVDGTNVITENTAPQSAQAIGAFIFDAERSPQETDLSSQPSLFGVFPFLSGVDHYVPAATPPDRTVEITSTPRDGGGIQRTFNVPNRASSEARISLYFPDHTQTR